MSYKYHSRFSLLNGQNLKAFILLIHGGPPINYVWIGFYACDQNTIHESSLFTNNIKDAFETLGHVVSYHGDKQFTVNDLPYLVGGAAFFHFYGVLVESPIRSVRSVKILVKRFAATPLRKVGH